MNKIPDQKTRQEALSPLHSFIVQAPAGSGKTELLIQRYLTCLALVKSPEEIIAITFTNKAADEMRDRLLKALALATGPKPNAPHQQFTWQLAQRVLTQDKTHNWGILENPSRLRIFTIDAFCLRLTQQLPVNAHLGAGVSITADPKPLYQHTAHEVLSHLEDDKPWSGAIETLLLHLDNDHQRIERLLVSMLGKRDQWLPHLIETQSHEEKREHLEQTLYHINESILQQVTNTLPETLNAEIEALADFAKLSSSPAAHSSSPAKAGDPFPKKTHYTFIANLLLTKTFSWRKQATATIGFPAPSGTKDKEEKAHYKHYKDRYKALMEALATETTFQNALVELLHAPDLTYHDEQWKVLDALITLLPVAAAQLRVFFAEQSQMDYTENSLAALHALGEETAPTDLALSLDYRIQHILLDEFQDTSITQFTLLEKLTMGWQPGDGHSLFLVGDPMQSIYRFRQAEVGLFIRAQQFGIGSIPLIPLKLTANFRSTETIIDWVNTTFDIVLPETDNIGLGAISYSPSVAMTTQISDTAVHYHITHDATDNMDEAMRIKHLIEHHRQQKENPSIAILVRSREHLRDIISVLTNAHIPYHAVDIDPLATRPIIQDLLSLTKALLHLSDRIAWLSILRAPWCGLTLVDLHSLAHNSSYNTLWEALCDEETLATLTPDGKQRCQHITSILHDAFEARQRSSLRDWIEATANALALSSIYRNDHEIRQANAYYDLIDECDQAGMALEMDEFERKVMYLYSPTQASSDTSVHVMTIHKSKGLEFDVVILPGLHKRTNDTDKPLLAWMDFPDETYTSNLCLSPIAETNTQEATYHYLSRKDKEKSRYELARLLYVATTRAKAHLHLCGTVAINEGGEIMAPNANTFLGLLWKAHEAAFLKQLTPAKNRAVTHDFLSTHSLKRLRSPHFTKSLSPIENPMPANTPVLQLHQDKEARIGTFIHMCLQRLADIGTPKWSSLDSQQHTIMLRHLAIQSRITASECAEAIALARRAINTMLNDPKGEWMLQAHEDASTEMPVTMMEANKPTHYIIDRTFIENNTRWIIDYKTSTPINQDIDAFLEMEKIKYQSQLEKYHAAFSAIESRPIKCALYFPLLPAFVIV